MSNSVNARTWIMCAAVAALLAVVAACRKQPAPAAPVGETPRPHSDVAGHARFLVELKPSASDGGISDVWIRGANVGPLTRMHRKATLDKVSVLARSSVASAKADSTELYAFLKTTRDQDPWDAESVMNVLSQAGFRDVNFDGMRLWKGDAETGRPYHAEDAKSFRDQDGVIPNTPTRR